jgi:hypothetical protein
VHFICIYRDGVNHDHQSEGIISMKIAIIRATGGTGRKVMERALELGHKVVAVARRPEVIPLAERHCLWLSGKASM